MPCRSFSLVLFKSSTKTGQTKATLGVYDKNQFDKSLLLILMTFETTMIWLSITLAQELMGDKKWYSEFKVTIPKICKYLKQIVK
jgi:hypothetical protein